ncbi:hypothetical protein QZH41_003958, partial [Actinostola sp. cb2023]
MAARFPELSKNSENTKKATQVSINVFRQYLEDRKVEEKELLSSKVKLAALLRTFYAEPRKKNGIFEWSDDYDSITICPRHRAICPTCRERLSGIVLEPHAKETKNCDESDHKEEEKEKGGHAEWKLITPEHLSRLRPRPETSDKAPDDIP